MKKLLLIAMVWFSSCAVNQPLSKTGWYKVTSAEKSAGGTIVELEGVKGRIEIASDTTEVNDTIKMIKVKRL